MMFYPQFLQQQLDRQVAAAAVAGFHAGAASVKKSKKKPPPANLPENDCKNKTAYCKVKNCVRCKKNRKQGVKKPSRWDKYRDDPELLAKMKEVERERATERARANAESFNTQFAKGPPIRGTSKAKEVVRAEIDEEGLVPGAGVASEVNISAGVGASFGAAANPFLGFSSSWTTANAGGASSSRPSSSVGGGPASASGEQAAPAKLGEMEEDGSEMEVDGGGEMEESGAGKGVEIISTYMDEEGPLPAFEDPFDVV